MHTLSLSEVSKSFAGVAALDAAHLDLRGGEIHALMGENGAGKSTLIKVLSGVQRADSAQILRDGAELTVASPADAFAAGFRFIHQELNIVPHLSVAENILLGTPTPRRFGALVDWRRMRALARAALARLGADHIDPGIAAGRLGTGDRILVKIAAALVDDTDTHTADLYVLDEPTAALTGAEAERLFAVLHRLRAAGAAILYVSHRMDEVMALSDRVTVLRDGKTVKSAAISNLSAPALIEAMTGRALGPAAERTVRPTFGSAVCTARSVTTPGLRDLDFTLHAGEILGVAGLAGAGQDAVTRLFMGLARVSLGSLTLKDRPAPRSPAEAWARGVAYIPRERRAEGLMLPMTVRANAVLPHLGALSRFGHTSSRAEIAQTRRAAKAVGLRARGPDQPVWQLSGGNQQKTVFARALGAEPAVLLLEEPTRGVDVGAKFDIHALIRGLARRGCAIILNTSDLPEMLSLCDRILIARDGRQTEVLPAAGLSAAGLLARFYAPETPASDTGIQPQ